MMFNPWTKPDETAETPPVVSPESILANEKLGQELEIELKKLEEKFKDFVTANSNQRYFGSSR